MSFSKKLKYFLVHELNISYKKTQELIDNSEVEVNGVIVRENIFLDKNAEVKVESKIIRHKKTFNYYLLNKPRGIECTLNPEIKNNLMAFIPEGMKLYPAGRLDKESEGLLLMTDDGDTAWTVMHTGMEKEYEVEVDDEIDELFCHKMSSGVFILGQTTKPCKVILTGKRSFRIILTQGLNRQIRRMSHKCGREVKGLKRIRIGTHLLGDLESGKGKFIISF
ncbi:MAG: pseudouridine synthase [Bacteroidota bacterium]